MARATVSFICIAAFMITAGCGSGGPEVNYVEGLVTLDGEPLPGATVSFSPVEGGTGRPATGVTDSNGVYKLSDVQSQDIGSGAATGEYRVSIVKITGAGEEDPDAWQNDPNYGDIPDATTTVTLKSAVPEKYNRAETSGLTATVESGKNENVDFELSSSS